MNIANHPLTTARPRCRRQMGMISERVPVSIRGAVLGLVFACAIVAQAELKFYTNVVMIQFYDNIGGTAISALTGSPKFPNSPDRVMFAPIPEIPVDAADNYGVRITGLLFPVATEAFRLIICSDDQSELYLSSDTNAANKVLIAREPEWNPSRAWAATDRRPESAKVDPMQPAPNVSVAQPFVENQPRYFELLMKEGTGGDNLAMTTIFEFLSVPDNGTPPDFSQFGLGVWADDVPKVLSGPRLKGGSAVAGQPTTFTAVYYAPPGTTSYQWFRNNMAIGGATDAEYTFTPAAGDAGAAYKVQVTVDGKSAQSAEVVLRFDAFSPGFAKVEFFYGIGGTAVDALIQSAKYQANTPDEVRFIAGASTPADIGDNYGARLSFRYTPGVVGSYRFFTRSDDASRIYRSTDGTLDVATATVLCEETACCGVFEEPPLPETSEPQTVVDARDTFLIFGLVKEATGGDFLQIASRREGDTTPAAGLRPLGGSVIGVMANGTGVGLSIVQHPQSVTNVEERTVIFEARGVATPEGTPVVYQWQRNGANIPGATGARLVLTNVQLSDNNTMYRAVIGTIGGIQQTTTAAQLTVVPDTFPPQPNVAALRTAAGEFQISVTWDEQVLDEGASNQVNYSVSPGTIASFKYWTYDQGAVLGLSGVQGGQAINVTVNNVSDLKGNTLMSPVTKSVTLSNLLSWTGFGADQFNTERSTDLFSDGAVAISTKDFDLISGGHQYWDNYDEGTFVYEEITGDFDRAVRVEYQDPTSQWARSGLQVREALDSGVPREQIASGYRFSQNYTIRVNPVTQWSGAAGNNAYELIHRPIEGGTYDPGTYPAIYAIQNGFGGVPNYPTAWMRVRRVGQTIEAYKSDDGFTWIGPATVTYTNNPDTLEQDESLAATVFVGMFYAPEMNNNDTANGFGHSGIAKFRDYGPFGGGAQPAISIAPPGIITFSDVLESATSLTGPWAPVANAVSPYAIPAGTNIRFYRSVRGP
ncbi:MAG: hypothetical protein L0Y58_20400 [Verrucomicrobia subdivision 3 bacterium]|nr:hypothetical protein [Limisphaerales bacterium]